MNVVLPVIPPSLALMVVVPHPVAVARPDESIVATLWVLDVQVDPAVTSFGGTLGLLLVPVAMNWVVWPICETLAFCGVIAIETRWWLLQPLNTAKAIRDDENNTASERIFTARRPSWGKRRNEGELYPPAVGSRMAPAW